MRHRHLAVVRGADDHGARAERPGIRRVAERGEQPPDLAVHHPVQVRVEVHVTLLLRAAAQRAQVRRLPQLHQRLHRRLVAQVLVHRGRQRHVDVVELSGAVPAGLIRRRVAEHVVRVHQGEDQAERLGQLGPRQPALDLPCVVLVPALAARTGIASAERRGLRVPACVRRLPLREAPVALDPRRVGAGPVVAADRLGQVPLALEGHVVAALAQQRAERGRAGAELRLAAALRPEPQGSPAERPPAAAAAPPRGCPGRRPSAARRGGSSDRGRGRRASWSASRRGARDRCR